MMTMGHTHPAISKLTVQLVVLVLVVENKGRGTGVNLLQRKDIYLYWILILICESVPSAKVFAIPIYQIRNYEKLECIMQHYSNRHST